MYNVRHNNYWRLTAKLPNLHVIPIEFYAVFVFSDCRITFLGFLCWGSSGLASSRGAGGILSWTAVTDTLRSIPG